MSAANNDTTFDEALDACCRRVQHGEPLEQCIASYPERYWEELAQLVPLGERLRQLGREPSPAFQARLERQLLDSLAETRGVGESGAPRWLRGFFAIHPLARFAVVLLLALVVLIGGGVGMVQASEGTLPDSPLYQVKMAREWAELQLAREREVRLDVQARLVVRRGAELEVALRRGKPLPVIEALSWRLQWTIERMVDQVLELKATGNTQPSIRALDGLRAMQRRVERLGPQAPPAARLSLERLRAFLIQQERRLVSVGEQARGYPVDISAVTVYP